ncbi:uncharacterized protein METZ01_LOCUS17146 [marine metagenome]|uniref:Uncharacterized protein n=1 Tax=marine metagenome TaxID=408172 RepID=A0A381PBC9_9ZZZZ
MFRPLAIPGLTGCQDVAGQAVRVGGVDLIGLEDMVWHDHAEETQSVAQFSDVGQRVGLGAGAAVREVKAIFHQKYSWNYVRELAGGKRSLSGKKRA